MANKYAIKAAEVSNKLNSMFLPQCIRDAQRQNMPQWFVNEITSQDVNSAEVASINEGAIQSTPVVAIEDKPLTKSKDIKLSVLAHQFVVKMEVKLNELTMDSLKDKCKQYSIKGISKLKKEQLVSLLIAEFTKLTNLLSEKTIPELKAYCKPNKLKCLTKKDELFVQLLEHCLENIIIELSTPTTEIASKPIMEPAMEPVIQPAIEPVFETVIVSAATQSKSDNVKAIEKTTTTTKKQTIPKQIRNIVWDHYIGDDIIKHKCLCCKKVTITNTSFEVGHVLSEKNGGTHEINNLRPICALCNRSMATENMVDFVVKYGLYIG